MADSHYPTIDASFIKQLMLNCNKINQSQTITIGKDTTVFHEIGVKPLFKRQIFLRQNKKGQLSYETCTGLAIRLGFMGELLIWLEQNRDWKDGAYFIKAPGKA